MKASRFAACGKRTPLFCQESKRFAERPFAWHLMNCRSLRLAIPGTQQLQAATASCKCKLQVQAAIASNICNLQLQAATASCNCKQQLQAAITSCNCTQQWHTAIASCNCKQQWQAATASCKLQLQVKRCSAAAGSAAVPSYSSGRGPEQRCR
jgi:hypothetical protein